MIPHSKAKSAGLVLKVSIMYLLCIIIWQMQSLPRFVGMCLHCFNVLYIMTIFVSGVQREILQISFKHTAHCN